MPASLKSEDEPNVLSADIRNLKARQEQIMDILKSVSLNPKSGDQKDLAAKLTNAYKATFSPLYNKVLKTPSATRDATSRASQRSTSGIFKPKNKQRKKGSRAKLNKDQIKELLTLTRIAQLTAIKKHGVMPLPTKEADLHTRVHELLKRPRVRMLIRYLVHSKKSRNVLQYLRSSYKDAIKRTVDSNKRHEITDKYNKAIKSLLQLWSKRLLKKRSQQPAPFSKANNSQNDKTRILPFLTG